MQDRPEAPDLLDAIADLMIKEVLPLVQKHGDDALAYKTLVSWNMLGVVARELRGGEDTLNHEIARMEALAELKDWAAARSAGESAPDASYQAKMASVRAGNAELARQIREQKIGPDNTALWEHVRQTLKEKLAVSNPRFSLSE